MSISTWPYESVNEILLLEIGGDLRLLFIRLRLTWILWLMTWLVNFDVYTIYGGIGLANRLIMKTSEFFDLLCCFRSINALANTQMESSATRQRVKSLPTLKWAQQIVKPTNFEQFQFPDRFRRSQEPEQSVPAVEEILRTNLTTWRGWTHREKFIARTISNQPSSHVTFRNRWIYIRFIKFLNRINIQIVKLV